jgi:hypothetical protein
MEKAHKNLWTPKKKVWFKHNSDDTLGANDEAYELELKKLQADRNITKLTKSPRFINMKSKYKGGQY